MSAIERAFQLWLVAFVAAVLLPSQAAHGAKSPPAPDLRASALRLSPVSVVAGGRVVARLRVVNAGRRPAGPAEVRFVVSRDGRLGRRDVTLAARGRTPRLRALGSARLTVRLTIRLPRPAGRYRLIACVDSRHAIRESSERNNCTISRRFQVRRRTTAKPPPPPPPPSRPPPPPPPPPSPPPPPPPPPPAPPPPPPPPPPTTRVEVHVFHQDDEAPSGRGGPAPDVLVRSGDSELGRTDDTGTLVHAVEPGNVELRAVIPSLGEGTVSLDVAPSTTAVADIVLDEGGVVEESTLHVDEIPGEVLPATYDSLTLRLYSGGEPVVAQTLDEVRVDVPDGAGEDPRQRHLTRSFSVRPDGSVALDDLEGVRYVLGSPSGQLTLIVQVVDADGFTYVASRSFYLGRYRVRVKLAAPPSNPALDVAGVAVRAALLNSPLTFDAVSDAAGELTLHDVPAGVLSLSGHSEAGGTHYYGGGSASVDADKLATITMRATPDVIAGVSPITTTLDLTEPPGMWVASPDARRQRDAAARRVAPTVSPPAAQRAASAAEPAEVDVTAAEEDSNVADTATLNIAQGTKHLTLKYTVATIEYPSYVLTQSVYNDTWSIEVRGGSGGEQLFAIDRGVNSQLYVAPTWQGNGSTGEIQEELDVTALARDGDATLTLSADTMNVGDGELPTSVHATLGADPGLTIDAMTPDGSNGGQFSIPREGDGNRFQRTYDLDYTAPEDADVTKVKAQLLLGSATHTIVDEAPGGEHVSTVDEDTLRVQVTFGPETSSIASDPPPVSTLKYRFTIEAQKDGDTLSDEKEAAVRNALWRMPAGISRYGTRDEGHDDWAAKATYEWLDENGFLITRVDDISGEHGRNIGHQGHKTGRDIDMFHVFALPGGAGSGAAAYDVLRRTVLAGLRGDSLAVDQVSEWAARTRTRFDQLIPRGDVDHIYYASGSATSSPAGGPGVPAITLADGWASALLRKGTVTATGGQHLSLGLGTWENGDSEKLSFNALHNSHFHLHLNVSGGDE